MQGRRDRVDRLRLGLGLFGVGRAPGREHPRSRLLRHESGLRSVGWHFFYRECATLAHMREHPSASVRLGCLAAAMVAGFLFFDLATATASHAATTSLLAGRGGVSLSAARMPKWRAMYGRHQASVGSAAWRRLVADAREAPRGQLVERVNQIVNRARYFSDAAIWGQSDYWASPAELFSRGGDCEDFAIAKYLLLKELGVPTSSMRVLITRDHAVLAVEYNGRSSVLDNRNSQTYSLSSGMMSRAVFAINDKTWWVNTRSSMVAAR